MLICFSLLAISTAWPLTAQETSGPIPGERIRIRQAILNAPQITGLLSNMSDRGLTIQPDSGQVISQTTAYSWEELKWAEVSLGSRRQTVQGFMVGFLAGALIADMGSCEPRTSGINICEAVEESFIPNLVSGIVFGFVGGLIGSHFRGEKWRRIEPPTSKN